jgi:hypothetical protein
LPEDSIKTGFSLLGFAGLAENPQAEARATSKWPNERLREIRITS